MDRDTGRSIVMLGFVGAGKSTYLAATYHIANSGQVPEALQITATERDLEYIESIHEEWLRCESLSRTSGHAPTVVSMTVTDSGDRTSRIHIPDVSGEALMTSLSDRRWDAKFDQAVQDADGILLFVHPDRVIEPLTHVEVQHWAGMIDGALATGGDDQSRMSWDVTKAATDPLLVDLLQVVVSRNATRPIRIAVLVSAWDLVGGSDSLLWLRQHLPLLNQFLNSNPDLFTSHVFGVSAQGGRYPEEEHALRAVDDPTDKVFIVGGDGDRRDLTEPIKRLLQG